MSTGIEPLEAVAEQSRVLRGRRLRVERLGGGISNSSFRVRTNDGGDYVCRVRGPLADALSLIPEQERSNAEVAASAGIGPEVIELVHDAGLLITRYVPGHVLRREDAADRVVIGRLAAVIRRLHGGAPFQGWFDLIEVRSRYRATIDELGCGVPVGFDELADGMVELEVAIGRRPEARVPCHNDLVPGNFLQGADRLWLIDYEFSSMNEPSFELGNLIQEWALDPADSRTLVSMYWGTDSEHKLARAIAWGVLACHTWLLWGAIHQATTANAPTDYATPARVERLRSALEGWRLQRLITDLAGTE